MDDYAVMERIKLAAAVPADLGWPDIGSWSAVWDVLQHDDAGNAIEGPTLMPRYRNTFTGPSTGSW
jgi:mannose-1-phosphate guanylyltransferase/mannose-6-phosphate isomerase